MTDLKEKALIVEAAILAAGEPVTTDRLLQLFADEQEPLDKKGMKAVLEVVTQNFEERGIELVEVASGHRFQAKQDYAPWLQRLWDKKPPRYSRALMETLALVIYKQPITRGEIEDVRGVAVSSNIMKTLVEHEWVKVVGYKEVPGKPALFATTHQFLDYFGLKSLSELPTLEDIKDLDEIGDKLGEQLQLEVNETIQVTTNEAVVSEDVSAEVEGLQEDSLDLLDALAEDIKPAAKPEAPVAQVEDDALELIDDDEIPQEAFA